MQVYGIRSVVVPSLFRRGFVQNAPPRSHLGRNAHPVTPTLPGTCAPDLDRKSTRLNSSHVEISYAVFCLKKKKKLKKTIQKQRNRKISRQMIHTFLIIISE